MSSAYHFRYLTVHFRIGIIISIIVPFIFWQGLFTSSCLIGSHFFLFTIFHWNESIPSWLRAWNHWGGRTISFLLFISLPHIVVWVVLTGVEFTLKQIVFWLESRRLALSLVTLLVIPFIPTSILVILILCSFEKVLLLTSF